MFVKLEQEVTSVARLSKHSCKPKTTLKSPIMSHGMSGISLEGGADSIKAKVDVISSRTSLDVLATLAPISRTEITSSVN